MRPLHIFVRPGTPVSRYVQHLCRPPSSHPQPHGGVIHYACESHSGVGVASHTDPPSFRPHAHDGVIRHACESHSRVGVGSHTDPPSFRPHAHSDVYQNRERWQFRRRGGSQTRPHRVAVWDDPGRPLQGVHPGPSAGRCAKAFVDCNGTGDWINGRHMWRPYTDRPTTHLAGRCGNRYLHQTNRCPTYTQGTDTSVPS